LIIRGGGGGGGGLTSRGAYIWGDLYLE